MEIAKVSVSGVAATTVEATTIPAGIIGATIAVEYGPEWGNMIKNVSFRGAEDVTVVNVGNVVKLPQEVAAKPNMYIQIGFTGVSGDGTVLIPTLWAYLGTTKPASPVNVEGGSTPPVWAQVAAMIGDLNQLNTPSQDNLVNAINDAAKSGNNNVDLSGYVKSVNGVKPDADGNVEVKVSSDSGQNVNDSPTIFADMVLAETVNAPMKLPIATHASGKDQPIHPKVLYFPELFGGHKFWMAYTPYPNGADREENPCIAYSDDLVTWVTPPGVTNPLDVPANTGDSYLSDTHLVYNADTKMLEIWYRGASSVETIYRRRSFDGVTWADREVMFRSSNNGLANYLSPVIIYEDGIYKIWAGSGNPSGYLKYYESADGMNWEPNATTNLVGWHFDVIHTESGYEAFISDTQPGASVSYAVSADGITWSEKTQLLTAGASGNWDASRLYRTSALKINGYYYVYYTGVAADGSWGIGLAVSTVANDVASIRGYVSGTAIKSTPAHLIQSLLFRVNALENSAGGGTEGGDSGGGTEGGDSGGGGSNDYAENFADSDWTEFYYGDDGEITTTPGLAMHHSDLMAVGEYTVTVLGTVTPTYLRISYFDANGNHVGWDRGAGLNANPGTSPIRSIDVSTVYGKYFAISANTADKPDILVIARETIAELEYISATGKQYFDTEVASSSTIGVEFKASYSDFTEKSHHILSDKDSFFFPVFRNSTSGGVFVKRGGTDTNTEFKPEINTDYVVSAFINDNKMVVNGQEFECPCGSAAGNGTLYVGAYPAALTNVAFALSGNIYYLKIYDGGTLIRDFVPAVKNGVIGMYDKLNDTLYESIGGTAFFAGPVASDG